LLDNAHEVSRVIAIEAHAWISGLRAALLKFGGDAAANELQRCVTEMKFVGAMLFPRSGADYLDHSRVRPIFDAAAESNVSLYIHPGIPLLAVRNACYISTCNAGPLPTRLTSSCRPSCKRIWCAR